MVISELVDRLQELKSIYGDLQVCVEDNNRPLLFQEHWNIASIDIVSEL